MQFIHPLPGVPIENLLDTPGKVREAREILEESTREDFEKLKRTKMASWHQSKEIIVD